VGSAAAEAVVAAAEAASAAVRAAAAASGVATRPGTGKPCQRRPGADCAPGRRCFLRAAAANRARRRCGGALDPQRPEL